MSTASPVSKTIVIHQSKPSQTLPTILIGIMGMGIIAALAVYQVLPGIDTLPITIMSAISVLAFGGSSLLAWRRRGDFELIDITNGRVMLRNSQSRAPIFDAELDKSKVQRLILPKGGMQLFLRDQVRATEIGQRLPPKQREQLALRLEEVMMSEAPLGFKSRSRAAAVNTAANTAEGQTSE